MNTDDLQKFLVIADTENLQKASERLDMSPSSLSKSLRKLERVLAVELFDRIGKHIHLNAAGKRFRTKAASLVAQVNQTKAEFAQLSTEQSYRIAGPSVLMFRWAPIIARSLLSAYPKASLNYESIFETEALEKVTKGLVDLAIVTTAAAPTVPEGIFAEPLGTVTMQVAAGKAHPLVSNNKSLTPKVALADLLPHPFAAPNISPYCGESRGVGCDGWKNDLFPRNLKIQVNDLGVLSQLVRNSQALAFLPDYWVLEWGLVALEITDCPFRCHETILLVSRQKSLLKKFCAH